MKIDISNLTDIQQKYIKRYKYLCERHNDFYLNRTTVESRFIELINSFKEEYGYHNITIRKFVDKMVAKHFTPKQLSSSIPYGLNMKKVRKHILQKD